MKAHKYWSPERLLAWQAVSTPVAKSCNKLTSILPTAPWSAWLWQSTPVIKLRRRRKKLKKSNYIRTSPSLCTHAAVRDFYFHYKLYKTNRTYFMASIMSLIPTFMPSSKAVFSHAQHTLPCWSMIFSQSGMSIP